MGVWLGFCDEAGNRGLICADEIWVGLVIAGSDGDRDYYSLFARVGDHHAREVSGLMSKKEALAELDRIQVWIRNGATGVYQIT